MQLVQGRPRVAGCDQGLGVFGVHLRVQLLFGRQVLVQKGLDLPLGQGAHEAIDGLAADQQHAGRYAADAKGLRQFGLGVGVDLDQLEASFVRQLQLFQQRADDFARTAPGGPEIDQHGNSSGGGDDFGLEVFDGGVDHGV